MVLWHWKIKIWSRCLHVSFLDFLNSVRVVAWQNSWRHYHWFSRQILLRNECWNSILMMHQYPDLGSGSDWSCHMGNLIQPIRSTTQIWVVMHHQYGSNFRADFSCVIWRENQWQCRQLSAVFSGWFGLGSHDLITQKKLTCGEFCYACL